jgi:hypothetical protein
MSISHQRHICCARGNKLELRDRFLIVRPEYRGDAADFSDYVSHGCTYFDFRAIGGLYYPGSPEGRHMKNPLSSITERLAPPKHSKIEKAIKVTAGTAAAVWVVLKLKRELYGPGGTRMSRYDRSVDDVWEEKT